MNVSDPMFVTACFVVSWTLKCNICIQRAWSGWMYS